LSEDFLTVGLVVSVWGNRGEVKVLPLTDFLDRFYLLENIIWEKDGYRIDLAVKSVRQHKKMILLALAGYDSPEEAKKLSQGYLKIPIEERIKLPEGEYYHFEIIGMEVFDINDKRVGVIDDIIQTGSNDVYVVRREGEKDLLLPALRSVVVSIDKDKNRLTAHIPEGLD